MGCGIKAKVGIAQHSTKSPPAHNQTPQTLVRLIYFAHKPLKAIFI